MAKFIIKFNNEVIDHIDLKQGDMKIGRRPGTDVHIDNLAVSGEHANVFTIGEDSFIEDLGSTNGTLINNKRITKHHLKNGDNIMIGKHTLVYMNDSQVVSGGVTDDFAKTVIISPGSHPDLGTAPATKSKRPEKRAPAAAGALGETRKGAVFVLSGTNSGKRIDLTKTVTSLGRTGKRSGAITRSSDGYVLAAVDGSDEVPTLNGRPLPASGALLKNGDIIEIAGTRLQFYYK